MKSRPLSLRIPETLERIVLMRAKEEHLDKATVVRQWMHNEAERYVLGLVQEGKITMAKAAEVLGITAYDLQDLALRHQVELGPTEEQLRQSMETVSNMVTGGRRHANGGLA